MSVLTVGPEYKTLLRKAAPKVIHNEEENEAYSEILYDLDRRSKELTPAEKDLHTDMRRLRCSDPFRPVWSQLSKVTDVECVESIATCFLRTV